MLSASSSVIPRPPSPPPFRSHICHPEAAGRRIPAVERRLPERMRLRTGFSRALQGISASRFRMTGKQCHPERSDLPTRRDGRGASPMRASFRSHSPPQIRSLPLPLAAVAYLPPPGHARIPSVERHSAGTRPPTSGLLRGTAPQNDRVPVILSVSEGSRP